VRSRYSWAGIDVGGPRKGFDVALLDADRRVTLKRRLDRDETVDWLRRHRPLVVAVDSPARPAEPGERSRRCERELVRAGICGIRYTPDLVTIEAPHPTGYYDWIREGFRLYESLRAAAAETGWSVIEVFPTASWSIWAGRKPWEVSRARWTAAALSRRRLRDVPVRLGQDARDAITAALTARLHPEGTACFGEIALPRSQSIATSRVNTVVYTSEVGL